MTDAAKAPLGALAKRLTLDAIYREKIFEAQRLREPHWMRDSRRFSYLDRAPGSETVTLWSYEVETGERTVVVDPKLLSLPSKDRPKPLRFSDVEEPDDDDGDEESEEEAVDKSGNLELRGYQWSPDEGRILFSRIPRRRAAHGDTALYVYTVARRTLDKVSLSDDEHRNVKWAPDGRSIGYVRGDDLYLLDIATRTETRLTATAASAIYNGRTGWVYEEELDLVDAWAFSPDGKRIAYLQVDETGVPEIDLPDYDDLHMKPVRTRYPKVADPNPAVRIGLIDLPDAGATTGAVPPTRWLSLGPLKDGEPADGGYIVRMQWTEQGDLLVQRMPRTQNRVDLERVEPATGAICPVLTEVEARWVDVPGDVQFVKGTDQFLWLSDRDGFAHLYLYDLNGALLRQVTHGEWEVDSVIGVDALHRTVYFVAARPSPSERQLFAALLDGGGDMIQLSGEPGTHRALLAPDGSHYLDTFSNRAAAPHVRLHRASGRSVAVVHENRMPKLEGHTLGDWEFTKFRTTDGVELNAALLKPSGFDHRRRYPVLMYTYGGPGSQTVTDAYGNGSGLEQYLAQKGYLFAAVDGRGSGGRGREFRKICHRELGKWETHDQIEGARWLTTLPYVDKSRIGVWGWSYGGYLAALCMLQGGDVFRAAAAVAPVTDWTLYDSIYTERYMGRPHDNPKGYADSSLMAYADHLKGAFLLIHGLADDNVHFQHSARLAAALQKENKAFETMFYPGKHHGLEGVSKHVFTTLTEFFVRSL